MGQRKLFIILLLCIILLSVACAKKEGPAKFPDVPAEYKDKHMPAGWWTDDKVLAAGKELYDGKKSLDINCAACHGLNGMPVLTGARDLRDASRVNQWSDGYWFWRISEGVPGTAMTAWKEKLSEEEIWQVIVYARTFSQPVKTQ